MFFNRLTQRCKQQNTTVYSAVSAVGGNTGSIDGWKKKGSIARPELLSKLADYLGTSVDYLLERTDNPTPVSGNMVTLDAQEVSLISDLRAASPSDREMVLRIVSAALAPVQSNIFHPTPLTFSNPKGGTFHHAKRTRVKRVEGYAAAGTPITAVPQDDLCISVPAKFLDERYFIIRAQGDSMIGADINNGDYCVFDRDAPVDDGSIVLAQVEGDTDQPEDTIKRLYRHGDQIELRPANRAYSSIFFPVGEVQATGVLVSVIPSDD